MDPLANPHKEWFMLPPRMESCLFRRHDVREKCDGWLLLSDENGTQVWVKDSDPPHFIRKVKAERLQIEYQYLLVRSALSGLHRPVMKENLIVVPDWGKSFLCRRLELGWYGTVEDLYAIEASAMVGYRYGCILWHVLLDDAVFTPEGEAVLVDSRYAMSEENAVVKFPTELEYIFYVRQQLLESWRTFLEKYGDEIDTVSQQIEEHEGPASARPREIHWPS